MRTPRWSGAAPAMAALMLTAACADPTGPGGPPAPIESLPRQLTLAEQEVVERSNAFAFHLLREVYERESESTNVFLSPLSASMALGMLLNGAAGETFDSIRATLGFDGLGQEEINRSYRDLAELLLGLDPQVELGIANSTWARQGFSFEPAFFDAVRTWFDAETRELDFADPASVDVINDWAAEKTHDRIPKVIDEISSDHILFLLNAVYFKGQWTHRFDAAKTAPAPFTLADGSRVQVDRMRGEPEIAYARLDDAIIGELPYGGRAFVMTLVLPPEDGSLATLIADLDAERWNRWTAALGEFREMPVEMPKLELEYETFLNDALVALGMGPAFDRARADFSRMTAADNAFVDFVKQNTFLAVDEEGTEAAAVTTIGVRVTSMPPSLVVDRPYILAIRERLSGTILFIGAIRDPRS